jgi:hypothetical protein
MSTDWKVLLRLSAGERFLMRYPDGVMQVFIIEETREFGVDMVATDLFPKMDVGMTVVDIRRNSEGKYVPGTVT